MFAKRWFLHVCIGVKYDLPPSCSVSESTFVKTNISKSSLQFSMSFGPCIELDFIWRAELHCVTHTKIMKPLLMNAYFIKTIAFARNGERYLERYIHTKLSVEERSEKLHSMCENFLLIINDS